MLSEEQEAVVSYIQSTPPLINEFLRGSYKDVTLEERDEFALMIDAFRHNSTIEEKQVYRGIMRHYLEDTKVFYQDFLISTTDEPINAFHFSDEDYPKVLLIINIPENTPVIDIGDLDEKYHRDFLETEGGEEIFPPEKLTVTKVENLHMESGGETKFRTVINPDGSITEYFDSYIPNYDKTKPYFLIHCDYEMIYSLDYLKFRVTNIPKSSY